MRGPDRSKYMSEATALVRLQEIDLTLMRFDTTARALPQRAKVIAAKTAAKKVAAELTKILGQRKDIEMDLADYEQQRQELNEQVQELQNEHSSGSDYRTTQDLNNQLSSLAKKLEKVEFDSDHLISELEAIEAREHRAQQLKERLAEKEQTETDSWRAATAEITQQVQVLSAERDRLVHGISPDVMRRYEAAKKRFGGIGVETLVGNRPSACRVVLQPSSFSDLRRSHQEITTCPYCKRMLVIPQED